MANSLPDKGLPSDRALLYLGTAQGVHVLQLDKRTNTWTSAGHGLTGHDISALAWDNRAPGHLLAGTAAGALFASANYGLDWEAAGSSFAGRKIWSITPDYPPPAGSFYLGLSGGYLFYTADN